MFAVWLSYPRNTYVSWLKGLLLILLLLIFLYTSLGYGITFSLPTLLYWCFDHPTFSFRGINSYYSFYFFSNSLFWFYNVRALTSVSFWNCLSNHGPPFTSSQRLSSVKFNHPVVNRLVFSLDVLCLCKLPFPEVKGYVCWAWGSPAANFFF